MATRNTAGKQGIASVLDPLQPGTAAGLLPHLRFPVPPPLTSPGPALPRSMIAAFPYAREVGTNNIQIPAP